METAPERGRRRSRFEGRPRGARGNPDVLRAGPQLDGEVGKSQRFQSGAQVVDDPTPPYPGWTGPRRHRQETIRGAAGDEARQIGVEEVVLGPLPVFTLLGHPDQQVARAPAFGRHLRQQAAGLVEGVPGVGEDGAGEVEAFGPAPVDEIDEVLEVDVDEGGDGRARNAAGGAGSQRRLLSVGSRVSAELSRRDVRQWV
jgi:hypothetical protein